MVETKGFKKSKGASLRGGLELGTQASPFIPFEIKEPDNTSAFVPG
jgi:hypothetical protein